MSYWQKKEKYYISKRTWMEKGFNIAAFPAFVTLSFVAILLVLINVFGMAL